MSYAHANMITTMPITNTNCYRQCVAISLSIMLQLSVMPAHAESMLEPQKLAGQILLDNTSETELVISNIDDETQVETKPTQRQRETTKLRWKAGVIPYQAEVQSVAQVTQMDPALIHAVIAIESGYNSQAQSKKGAYGLMQVLPATALTLTPIPIKQWSARQQILWGASYLKKLLDMFEGDVALALAAYNAGPQAVKSHKNSLPPFSETRRYVPRVLSNYRVFKSRLTPEPMAHDTLSINQ